MKRLSVAYRCNAIAKALKRTRLRTHIGRLVLIALAVVCILQGDRLVWLAHVQRLGRAESRRLQQYEAEGRSASDAFGDKLTRYVAWRAAEEPSAPILRWSCSSYDGMGDRMRGVLHAFVLAVETGRRFELHAPVAAGFGAVALPAAVMWNVSRAAKDVKHVQAWARWDAPELAVVFGVGGFQAWYGRTRVIHLHSRNVVHYERLLGSQWYGAHCPSRMERCWYDGAQNLAMLRQAHNALFAYKRAVTERVERTLREGKLEAGRYISIHARVGYQSERGRHAFRFSTFHGKRRDASIHRLLRCAAQAARHRQMPPTAIYLASDDPSYRRRVAELVRGNSVLAHMRLVHSAVHPRHTGVRRGWNAAAKAAVRDTVVEAFILGRASALITTGSGLSVYAAITGTARLLTPKHCET